MRRRYHRRNPLLAVVNPPPALIASDVQAILYRHADDGELYCHSFGGVDASLTTHRDGSVTIKGLKEDTGVRATVRDGGRRVVLSHRDGLSVAQEF